MTARRYGYVRAHADGAQSQGRADASTSWCATIWAPRRRSTRRRRMPATRSIDAACRRRGRPFADVIRPPAGAPKKGPPKFAEGNERSRGDGRCGTADARPACRSTYPMPSRAGIGVVIARRGRRTTRVSTWRCAKAAIRACWSRCGAISRAASTSQIVDAKAFDKHLSDHYAMDGSARSHGRARSAMGGDDLDFIAGDMPTAEDLLDSGDDAPAIRLINGIIAEAARQGVSRHPYRAL